MAKSKKQEVLQPSIWMSTNINMQAPNPDIIRENLNVSYKDYRYLSIDENIKKGLRIAKAFPSAFPYTFIQNDCPQNVYEWVVSKFEKNKQGRVSLKNIISTAIDADFYGFSVLQTLFENRELKRLINFFPENFDFNMNGDLRNIYSMEILETYAGDNRSFIVCRNDESNNNYNGEGLCQALYYMREMRKSLLKIIQISSDKYGITPYLAITEFDATQKAEYENASAIVAQKMESLRAGGVATLNGKNMQIIPLTNNLSVNDLWAIYNAIGVSMTGLINGATDGIESGDKGSYARAFIQNETVRLMQQPRFALIEDIVNQLVRWMIDLKFGENIEAPYFSYQTDNQPQFADLITAYNSGIPIQRDLLTPYIGDDKTGDIIVKQPEQPLQFTETSKKKILNLKI